MKTEEKIGCGEMFCYMCDRLDESHSAYCSLHGRSAHYICGKDGLCPSCQKKKDNQVVILDDNELSIMQYAKEFPDNCKKICKSLEKDNHNQVGQDVGAINQAPMGNDNSLNPTAIYRGKAAQNDFRTAFEEKIGCGEFIEYDELYEIEINCGDIIDGEIHLCPSCQKKKDNHRVLKNVRLGRNEKGMIAIETWQIGNELKIEDKEITSIRDYLLTLGDFKDISIDEKDNHNYDLVNRNNVTGQTVKDANHISPNNQPKPRDGSKTADKNYSEKNQFYPSSGSDIPSSKIFEDILGLIDEKFSEAKFKTYCGFELWLKSDIEDLKSKIKEKWGKIEQ